MSDTVRTLGFEDKVTCLNAITPVAYSSSSTHVQSSAIDTRSYPRARILILAQNASDAGGDGIIPDVVEGATSSPADAVATATSPVFVIKDGAAAAQLVSYQRNPAKPFIKVGLTPDGGSGVMSAAVLFIFDGI